MAKQKSLKTRVTSALVSLVLAFGLLPALPAVAFADASQYKATVIAPADFPVVTCTAEDLGDNTWKLSYDVSGILRDAAWAGWKAEDGTVLSEDYEATVTLTEDTTFICGWEYPVPNFSLEENGNSLPAIKQNKQKQSTGIFKIVIPHSTENLYSPNVMRKAGMGMLSTWNGKVIRGFVVETNYTLFPVGAWIAEERPGFAIDDPSTLLDEGNYDTEANDYYGIQARMNYIGGEPMRYVVFEVPKFDPEPAADPELQLATDAADLKAGQEFTVNVSMKNITAAAQAELTWSENLQLVKVEAGSALSGEDMAFENVEGNGLFSFVANEGEADGVVAVATFKCAAPGEAAVGLTEGLAGKTIDSAEYTIASPEALELSVALAGIKGDVNNNTKVNIVDAQIAYDLCVNKYAEGSDAAASLLACWGTGATLDMVKAIADVNTVPGLDAGDAFAIQYAVHHNGVFGE